MVPTRARYEPPPSNVRSITLPLPRARLAGCSCRSPLAHFFIHHSDSSLRELHPFTTITHLASQNASTPASDDNLWIQFLFRKSSRPPPADNGAKTGVKQHLSLSRLLRTKKQRVQSVQWTEQLAGLVDEQPTAKLDPLDEDAKPDSTADDVELQSPALPPSRSSTPSPKVRVALRLEGPYFSPADPARYPIAVCLVAGTGISGALAVAGAFAESRRRHLRDSTAAACAAPKGTPCVAGAAGGVPTWRRCVVVWSVREAYAVELPFADGLAGTELQVHRTGPGRPRLDIAATLAEVRAAETAGTRMWVYISGPKAFIDAGKAACKGLEGCDFYAASWDV